MATQGKKYNHLLAWHNPLLAWPRAATWDYNCKGLLLLFLTAGCNCRAIVAFVFGKSITPFFLQMRPVLYHEYRSVWRARRGAPSSFFHEYDLLYHHGSFLFWHSLPCFWQALPCKLTSHMHTVRCHSVLPWKYHAPTRPGLIQTGASGT